MARHSKNCTASSFFTYSERQKLEYGTKKQRLGKDSLTGFDCCCLTLQQAVDPIITPNGYLYSREAIYNNLLDQKNEIKRKLELWEKQQQKQKDLKLQKEEQKKLEELIQFERRESSILTSVSSKKPTKLTVDDVKKEIQLDAKNLRSFWVPGLTPESETILQKPSTKTICPESGKSLRLKQLIPIQFVPIQNVKDGHSNKVGKWMCALCSKVLMNKVICGVTKSSRKVMCWECIENFVIPEMKDPLSGLPVLKKDIIKLQSGGTGYAGRTEKLVAVKQEVSFIG